MPIYKAIPNTPANIALMPDLIADIPEINTQYRSRYMVKNDQANVTVGAYLFGSTLVCLVWLTSEQELATFDAIGFSDVEQYLSESALLAAYGNLFDPPTI